jgi:dual specificity phosphatase 12
MNITSTYGVNRSAAFVLAYLILKEKMPLLKAMVLLSSKHSISSPAPWFMSQLCSIEQNGLPPAKKSSSIEYKCKKCRNTLFKEEDLTGHISTKKKHKKFDKVVNKDVGCTSYFTGKMEWMKMDGDSGKLCCPYCHMKIGSYAMYGLKCSCGCWSTPGYQFHKDK